MFLFCFFSPSSSQASHAVNAKKIRGEKKPLLIFYYFCRGALFPFVSNTFVAEANEWRWLVFHVSSHSFAVGSWTKKKKKHLKSQTWKEKQEFRVFLLIMNSFEFVGKIKWIKWKVKCIPVYSLFEVASLSKCAWQKVKLQSHKYY